MAHAPPIFAEGSCIDKLHHLRNVELCHGEVGRSRRGHDVDDLDCKNNCHRQAGPTGKCIGPWHRRAWVQIWPSSHTVKILILRVGHKHDGLLQNSHYHNKPCGIYAIPHQIRVTYKDFYPVGLQHVDFLHSKNSFVGRSRPKLTAQDILPLELKPAILMRLWEQAWEPRICCRLAVDRIARRSTCPGLPLTSSA
jgi:hypothetical protein